MNKEFIEKQLKLHKRQTNDERYDYLCREFNGINYCVKLESYTISLLKENKLLQQKYNQALKILEENQLYLPIETRDWDRYMEDKVKENGK